MKYFVFIALTLFSFQSLYAGCGSCKVSKKNVVEVASPVFETSVAKDGSLKGLVLASCGMCNFGMKNQRSCSLAIKVGEEVSGVVEELQSRGALVKIQNVKAFLPISEIQDDRVSQMSDVLKIGEVVNGVVLEIDKRQWKMKISLKQLVESKSRKEFEEYLKTEEKVQKQTLGDLFADKLKEFK